MISLKEAILIKLRDKKGMHWQNDDNEILGKKQAYNDALTDMLYFIHNYEDGDVSQEYLITLAAKQQTANGL